MALFFSSQLAPCARPGTPAPQTYLRSLPRHLRSTRGGVRARAMGEGRPEHRISKGPVTN